MDIEEQIEAVEQKILEMGLSDIPIRYIEDVEYHLLKLREIQSNDKLVLHDKPE